MSSFDLSGDTIAVADEDSQSVKVYRRVGATWTLEATLIQPSTDSPQYQYCQEVYDYAQNFGAGDLSLFGDRLAVASQCEGRYYVFNRIGGTWLSETVIETDATSFQMYDDEAVGVGPYDSGTGTQPIVTFSRTGSLWSEVTRIEQSERVYNPVMSGDRIAVAWTHGALVYERIGAAWQMEQRLLDPQGLEGSHGRGVSLEGDTLVFHNNYSHFVFHHNGTSWGQQGTLASSTGDTVMQALTPVALRGDTIVASWNNGNGAVGMNELRTFTRFNGEWSFRNHVSPESQPWWSCDSGVYYYEPSAPEGETCTDIRNYYVCDNGISEYGDGVNCTLHYLGNKQNRRPRLDGQTLVFPVVQVGQQSSEYLEVKLIGN